MTSASFVGLSDYLGQAEARLVVLKLVRNELLAGHQRDFKYLVLGKKFKRLVVNPTHFLEPDLKMQLHESQPLGTIALVKAVVS